MTTVSHSEANALLSCERKHYYQYGLGLERKIISDALSRGKLGHATLEVIFKAFIDTQDWTVAFDEGTGFLLQELANGTDPNFITTVTRGINAFRESEIYETWQILAVEKEYVAELTEELRYPFVVDLIITNDLGENVVVDTKFNYDFYNAKDLAILPQLPKYFGTLRHLGFPVDKVAYLELRTRPVKSEALSDLVRYTEIDLPDARVNRSLHEQIQAAERAYALKQLPIAEWSKRALRTSETMVCDRCPMHALCSAELSGEDAQMTLDTQYKVRTRRTFT